MDGRMMATERGASNLCEKETLYAWYDDDWLLDDADGELDDVEVEVADISCTAH